MDGLRRRCDLVAERFTTRWNEALTAVDPAAPTVADAFRITGDRVLLHWPAPLHRSSRTALLPTGTAFGGPLTRREPPADPPGQPADQRPLVYVALGTFLSHRGDVLAAVADGLRQVDVRVAMATGATPIERIGSVPATWRVAPRQPQVGLLAHARVAIHHGGNNSVQESLAAGVHQVVLPFSTDQFAIAADLERAGRAVVLDPNRAAATDIADAVADLLDRSRPTPIETDVDAVLASLA